MGPGSRRTTAWRDAQMCDHLRLALHGSRTFSREARDIILETDLLAARSNYRRADGALILSTIAMTMPEDYGTMV